LELMVLLPKASLLGSGVSMTACVSGDDIKYGPHFTVALKLHDLQIATIIGINSNERLSKQIIIANIELERFNLELASYEELEQIVVKTIEESSFGTLEKLANHVFSRIEQLFTGAPDPIERVVPKIRIRLEKPTAVPFADAPAIEISRCVDDPPGGLPGISEIEDPVFYPPVPFPLKGRLDDWLATDGAGAEV